MKRVPVTLNDLYEGCLLVPKFSNCGVVLHTKDLPEDYKPGKSYKFHRLDKQKRNITNKLDLGKPVVYVDDITKDADKRPYQRNMHVVMQNFQLSMLSMHGIQNTFDIAIEEKIDEEDCV